MFADVTFYLSFKVACFYIKFPGNDFHHAIYISDRTVYELRDQISRKAQIKIHRIIHEIPGGRKISVDEDFVRQLPDRQVLTAEFVDGIDIVLQ